MIDIFFNNFIIKLSNLFKINITKNNIEKKYYLL